MPDAAWTFQSDSYRLSRVLLKHARDAFVSQAAAAAQWRDLNYLAEPDLIGACRESDALADLLQGLGVAAGDHGQPAQLPAVQVCGGRVKLPCLRAGPHHQRVADARHHETQQRHGGRPQQAAVPDPGQLQRPAARGARHSTTLKPAYTARGGPGRYSSSGLPT